MADKAPILVVADAVVDKLVSVELSQGYIVARKYIPVHLLTDLDQCRVAVVPTGQTGTTVDRSGQKIITFTFDLGIQKKVPSDLTTPAEVNAWVDPMVGLAQEIADVFSGKRLSTYDEARCTDDAIAPVCDPLALDEKRVFSAVVALTFQILR